MRKTFNEFLLFSVFAVILFCGIHAAQVDEYIENKNPFHKEKVLRKTFPEWYFSDWRYSWKYAHK
jgi:hypothetical protein